ncbi:hypothetical protein [Paenibacillus sp. ACRRY]|uniref:hypothetical protein n=1 Tax=Paenibacillus sp. ACRRY TaxID=2918208 RepID=UPI001EF74C36|nr:hypothetical protein [Paenibacillus sp. ACRRY]
MGLMLVILAGYFYWIRDQTQISEVAFETIELAQAPSEVMEVIEEQARKFEVLAAEHEGWIYVYYGIDEGDYKTIDMNILDTYEHYVAQITVRDADNDQWINSYKLVRFKCLDKKSLITEVTDRTQFVRQVHVDN